MGVPENKKVALDFFEYLSAGNMDAFFDLLTDDVDYWIQGSLEFSGTKSKPEMLTAFKEVFSMIDGGVKMTPKGITAEGDRVAVEAESYAKVTNGKTIQNTYHMLFVIRDGKISSAREYFDTLHMSQVLA